MLMISALRVLQRAGKRKKKRKRSKKEAKELIESIPVAPPIFRRTPVGLVTRGAKEGAKVLVELDPLDRLAPEPRPQPIPIIRPRPESFIPSPQEVTKVTPEEVIAELVNNPMIELTEEMLPIINDPSILMNGNGDLVRTEFGDQFRRDKLLPKKKRKRSKYQMELGRQLKMLKKKHPRTAITQLMKRAHRLTKKALK